MEVKIGQAKCPLSPRFSIFANLCRSAGFLQIFADMRRFEKTVVLRNTLKTRQRCQMNNKNV